MITFIVTTYNLEEHLLRRCLESIVSQGFERDDYEVIVVDDESDVSPQYVVDEFSDRANIHLYIQFHSRQGAARNLALNHAKGEWIEFVDGDDYLFPNTVKSCLAIAEDNDLDLLMFGFQEVFSLSAIKQSSFTAHQSPTITGNEYMSCNNLFGCCWPLLFRRELLEEPIYGEPLRFAENTYIEDEEFVTRLVWRAQRMVKIDAVVYAYYQRQDSTVHNRSREHTDELFRAYFVVLRRLLEFEISIAKLPHEGVTRKIRFFAIDILRRALRDDNWKERWNQSVQQLRDLGLYPISRTGYSWKYRLFRLLANHDMGHYMLRITEKH